MGWQVDWIVCSRRMDGEGICEVDCVFFFIGGGQSDCSISWDRYAKL